MDNFYLFVIGAFLAIAGVFIACCIVGGETFIDDDAPLELPGEDYNYSERPYYER